MAKQKPTPLFEIPVHDAEIVNRPKDVDTRPKQGHKIAPQKYYLPQGSKDPRWKGVQLEKGGGERITVPDQSITVEEILERATRGIPPTGNRNPMYNINYTLPDVESLDLVEQMELKAQAEDYLENAAQQVKNSSTRGQAGQARKEEIKATLELLSHAIEDARAAAPPSDPVGVQGGAGAQGSVAAPAQSPNAKPRA